MAYAFVSATNTTFGAGVSSNTQPGLTLVAGQRCLLTLDKSTLTETVTGVTDNGGNTWTLLATTSDTYNGSSVTVWESATATAATSITVTYSASMTGSVVFNLLQYTGLNPSIAGQIVSSVQTAPTIATDAMTSGALTPAAQPGALIGIGKLQYNTAFVSGTGFSAGGADTNWHRYEDKPITSASAVAATFTASINYPAVTIGVYWQEAMPASYTMSSDMYF